MLLLFVLVLGLYSLQATTTTNGFDAGGENGVSIVFSLDEELPIGTLIGSLTDKLGGRAPTSSSGVQFMSLGQERYIQLNQTSGELSILSRIDRESLCEQVGTCCSSSVKPTGAFSHAFESDSSNSQCAIKLIVIDQQDSMPSSQPKLVHITFSIIDINDNPPKWSPDSLEIEIPEHSPIGTVIQLPEAVDPDQTFENAPIRYELIPQPESTSGFLNYESRDLGDAFLLSISPIDQPYDAVPKFNLQLKINSDLDRERRDSYRLLLVAVDGSSKGPIFGDRTGTLNILIKVTDINDQVPFFTVEHFSIDVSEDIVPGTKIFTMTAKDDDPSDASRLVYRFASTASGEVMRLFNICEKTGTITVAQSLDYEVAPLLKETRSSSPLFPPQTRKTKDVGYIIPVKVTDGVHFAQAELRVRLKNVNDNAPNITIQSHLQRWRNKNDLLLPEDAAVGSMIATITIEDADERWLDNEAVSGYSGAHCSTTHPFFTVQPLYPSARYQYMLVTSGLLDRETKAIHTVAISCHDSGQPALSRGMHIVIHLEDLNDSPPVFSQSIHQYRIPENLPINTLIDKLQASDADIGLNGAIRYTIAAESDKRDLVKLSPVSGQLHTAAIFDREKTESINFTVIAMDCVGGTANTTEKSRPCEPINSASTSVVIMIEDVNDCIPEFDQNSYEFVVREGQGPQQSIGSVRAIDRDTDSKNSRIQYSISENGDNHSLQGPKNIGSDGYHASSLFAITSSGEIYTRNLPIDREKTPILSFTVVASDYGHPSLSAFANVVIRVQDVNDHSPAWVFPQSTNNKMVRVNLSSYATVGKEIAHLKAVDSDSGPNGEIEYSIIKGNEQEYFALDKNSGTLYLAKPLLQPETNETDSRNQESTRQLSPQSFILALMVTDKGEEPRSNTTVLKIVVTQNAEPERSSQQFNQMKGDGGWDRRSFPSRHAGVVIGDRDLMIITAMIVIALLISFVLIAAIVFLRCRRPIRSRSDLSTQSNCNEAQRLIRRFEILNCLNAAEATNERKGRKATTFVLTDTEKNPNFEEHIPNHHYSSTNATPMHGAFQILPREGEVYGSFPSTVIVASSTLPCGKKLPMITSANDGAPIGYIVTSNPSNADPKFIAYENTANRRQGTPDDNSSSSTDLKAVYSSLLYRVPDGSAGTVEKNYMTINPDLFQQSIYRRLNINEESFGEPNSKENGQKIRKNVSTISHDMSTYSAGMPDRRVATSSLSEETKSKKHCRFTNIEDSSNPMPGLQTSISRSIIHRLSLEDGETHSTEGL